MDRGRIFPREEVVLLLAGGLAAAAATAAPPELRLIDRAARPAALRRLERTARRALPVLEDLLALPYPGPARLEIRVYPERGPETFGEVGAYAGEGDRSVRVVPEITDWMLVHELAHVWLHRPWARDPAGAERWLIEGLAHWAAVETLRRVPALGDPTHAHRVLLEETMGRAPQDLPRDLREWIPPIPLPRAPEPGTRDRQLGWYGRAYALLHLADQRLPGGLPAWHRALRGRLPTDTAGYLSGLSLAAPALGPADDRALRDADRDGLSRAAEDAAGTSAVRRDTDRDGLGDGLEAWVLGSSPLSGPPRGLPPGARSLTGDRGGLVEVVPAPADLLAFRAGLDDDLLWVEVETLADLGGSDVHWNVGLDLDGDDTFDRILGLGGDRVPYLAEDVGDWARAAWHPWPSAPARIGTRRATFALPRAALGLEGTPRAFAYTLVGPARTRVDALGWIPLPLR